MRQLVDTTELLEGGDRKKVGDSKRRDMDWSTKIAKAKEARQAAQKAREGKPATFPVNRFVHL